MDGAGVKEALATIAGIFLTLIGLGRVYEKFRRSVIREYQAKIARLEGELERARHRERDRDETIATLRERLASAETELGITQQGRRQGRGGGRRATDVPEKE